MESKRIKDLELGEATYLLPREEWPEHPSYHIDYWHPNCYYGNEDKYIKDGDWYLIPDLQCCKIHKDCFKNPEARFAIASFDYNKHEEVYELHFVGDRPLSIPKELRDTFWELVEYGYKELNKNEEEEE